MHLPSQRWHHAVCPVRLSPRRRLSTPPGHQAFHSPSPPEYQPDICLLAARVFPEQVELRIISWDILLSFHSYYTMKVYNKPRAESKHISPGFIIDRSLVRGISMPKTKLIPYLEVFFAVVVWGASFIATKIALAEISPITIVWLRFAMGVVILGVAVALRRQFALPNKNEWGYFALLGFLGITFHQGLQSNGLITSEASTTAWIVAATPVFMALLGWLVLKEGLGRTRISGILLAFIGVLVVVSDGEITSISIGKFGTPGDVLILISAVNWAVFSTLSRRG